MENSNSKAFNDIIPLGESLFPVNQPGFSDLSDTNRSTKELGSVYGVFDTLKVGSGGVAFKTDSSGSWWGAEQFVDAPAKIGMDGHAVFTDLELTGGILKFGKTAFDDSVNLGYILSEDGFYIGSANDEKYFKFNLDDGSLDFKGGIVDASEITNIAEGTDISILGWQSTLIFGSTVYNAVTWSSGVIRLATGEVFNIDAGSASGLTGIKYLYFNKDLSTTTLQSTATESTAVGKNKILVAVVKPNVDTASQAVFQVFGGSGGLLIKTDQLAANSVTANEIAANSIAAGHIQTNAITADKISAGAIIADKIGAGAVIAGKIAANAVTAGTIVAGSITGDRLAANTITATQIAANAITATEINTGAITAGKIAAGAINASNIIVDGVITASKLNVSTLSAISANIGSVTAGNISGVGISGSTITLPREAVGGGSGYLRWQDFNSRIWVDTGQDMGLRANGGNIYFYAPTLELLLTTNLQAILYHGLECRGNLNVTGDGRFSNGKSLYFGTSDSSHWVDYDGLAGTSGVFYTSLAGRLQVSNSLDPSSAANNLGGPTRYWGDVSYKTLTDRGCLGWFDEGVELQDGRKVSDLESLREIKKHPTKKTIYGAPMLDYKTFPKVAYKKAAGSDGVEFPRDENDEPYTYEEDIVEGKDGKKEKKVVKLKAQDGIEMTSMFSIMIGAFKEALARIETLEAEVKTLANK